MTNKLILAALAASLSLPVATVPAMAQRHDSRDYDSRDRGRDSRWQGDRDGDWDPSSSYQRSNYRERRLSRNDRIYKGRDGRAYCKRNDGTTGLVVGGIGGGLLANLIGGGTLGTLAGAGGGALLGRSIDRGNVKCR